jgi:hypothetical protein
VISTFGIPLSVSTFADRIRTKLPGSAWMSGHWIPISVILIGSQSGHMKSLPVAPPIVRKTPKPGFVTNVPLPRNAKLRASPLIFPNGRLTSAPTDAKLASSSVGPAGVELEVLGADRQERSDRDRELVDVHQERPRRASAPNSTPTLIASVSASGPSRIEPCTVMPGRNTTPPEAMNIATHRHVGRAELHLEVMQPDAEVVELEDQAEPDLSARRRVRDGEVLHREEVLVHDEPGEAPLTLNDGKVIVPVVIVNSGGFTAPPCLAGS